MTSLQVHIEALERLAARLSGTADDTRAALRQLGRADASQLGTPGLDDACHELRKEWGHGMSEISELSDRMADRLLAAARTYRATEDAITRAAGGHRD